VPHWIGARQGCLDCRSWDPLHPATLMGVPVKGAVPHSLACSRLEVGTMDSAGPCVHGWGATARAWGDIGAMAPHSAVDRGAALEQAGPAHTSLPFRSVGESERGRCKAWVQALPELDLTTAWEQQEPMSVHRLLVGAAWEAGAHCIA